MYNSHNVSHYVEQDYHYIPIPSANPLDIR